MFPMMSYFWSVTLAPTHTHRIIMARVGGVVVAHVMEVR